jgi:hypothetical protein
MIPLPLGRGVMLNRRRVSNEARSTTPTILRDGRVAASGRHEAEFSKSAHFR